MGDRYIPLISCPKCGTIRRADFARCPGMFIGWCTGTEGNPVTLVDHEHLAVQVDVLVNPNPRGEGLK